MKLRGKKGFFIGFIGIRLVSFLIAAINFLVLAIIAIMIWNIFAPDKESYDQSKLFFDDIVSKIEILEQSDSDRKLISQGYLDEDVCLHGGEGFTINKCPNNGNPCICICEGDNSDCNAPLKCKAFSKIKTIKLGSDKCGKEFLSITIEKENDKITLNTP